MQRQGEKTYEENRFQTFCRTAFCGDYFFRHGWTRVCPGTDRDHMADAGRTGGIGGYVGGRDAEGDRPDSGG